MLFRTIRGDRLRPGNHYEENPDPEGNWLAYNSTEQEEELFVASTDGSRLRQLTNGGYRNRGPRWSPDGKQIAFFSTRSGDWEIWTTDANGGEFHQVTNLAGNKCRLAGVVS